MFFFLFVEEKRREEKRREEKRREEKRREEKRREEKRREERREEKRREEKRREEKRREEKRREEKRRENTDKGIPIMHHEEQVHFLAACASWRPYLFRICELSERRLSRFLFMEKLRGGFLSREITR